MDFEGADRRLTANDCHLAALAGRSCGNAWVSGNWFRTERITQKWNYCDTGCRSPRGHSCYSAVFATEVIGIFRNLANTLFPCIHFDDDFYSWSTLKLLTSVAAGVYGACWAFKLAHSLKNRWIIRRLQRTVELLNEIDSGIRRTIAYLREVKVLKLDDKKAM